MERLLPIGRFARLAQLSLKALRLYDRRGLLAPAIVDVHTGRRYYRPDQVPTARLIRRLRLLELPLDDIRDLIASRDAADARRVLEQHRLRLEGRVVGERQAIQVLKALVVEWERIWEEGTMEAERKPSYRCSFCDKTQLEAGLLIGSADRPGEEKVCICRECLAICNEMVADHERKAAGA